MTIPANSATSKVGDRAATYRFTAIIIVAQTRLASVRRKP
jgi:hypothetical protein